MPLPYPLPDDPRKWSGWTSYNSKNLYERLGLTYQEQPSIQLIEESCRQLLLWWQKKLPLKSQPSNPLSQLLGKAIDDAPRLITEAKVTLLDPVHRETHDAGLESLGQEKALVDLRKFLDFVLADKKLTPSAESNLMAMGRQMGVTPEIVVGLIDQVLVETESSRYDPVDEALKAQAAVHASMQTAPARPTASTPVTEGSVTTQSAPPDQEGFMRLIEQWKERTDYGELEDEDKEKLLEWAPNFRLTPEWAEALLDGRDYDPDAGKPKAKPNAKAVTPAKPAAPKLSPEEERRTFPNFTNSLGMPMMTIPSASFQMGSIEDFALDNEAPVTQVTLTGYWVCKYPVTNAQYELFDPTHRSKRSPWADENHPVVNVNYEDAVKFCDWLAKKENKRYRLPSEAEWEHAAKGTDNRKFPWGANENNGKCANFADASSNFPWSATDINDGFPQTSPIGSFSLGASPFGCEDMSGNVGEWCRDSYGPYKGNPVPNPCPTTGAAKVIRGGSFRSKMNSLRTTSRASHPLTYFSNDIGFRIACARDAKG